MEKPTTKAKLLNDIRDERKRLEDTLKGLTDTDMIKTIQEGEWSVKDILAHVAAWEQWFLKHYQAGLRGEKQVIPDWKQPGLIDDMNKEFYERNRDRKLGEVRKEFRDSYKLIFKTVELIPEEDMFIPGKYDWLGKDTLAQYIIVNTSEHYLAHLKMIETIKKKLGK
jgi:hypothetical protein